MAVTITAQPAADFAAFAPVIIEGTTNRNPFVAGVRETLTIAKVKTAGGKVVFEMSATITGGWQQGDTVLVEGLTGTMAVWNGRHEVDDVVSTDIETLTVGTPTTTTMAGTMTRLNENLAVRLEVLNATDSIQLEPVFAPVAADGTFKGDVSKSIQAALKGWFSLTAGQPSLANVSKEITVEFTEVFLAVDYSLKEIADPAAGLDPKQAHLSTDIAGMIAGTVIPYSTFRAKDKILFHFLHGVSTFISVRITQGATVTTTAMTITRKHGAIVYQIPAGNTAPVLIEVLNTEPVPANVIKTPLLVRIASNCTGKRLYYLNHKGGYYSFEVVEYEDKVRSEKIDRYTTESYIERTLRGAIEWIGTSDYLNDLIDSREVRDEAGELVHVLTTDLKVRGENIQPEVTIKIKKDLIK